ncbi:MAG: type 4a pilus biogenesis protein PilO [Candidatus Omnitrophica bacterium]|nr:type 4a pilus biogenesis protein PilO [Candidatus Omnitrophota bacterium]
MIFTNLKKREKLILTITIIVVGFGLFEKNVVFPMRKKMNAFIIKQKNLEKNLENFLSMSAQEEIIKSSYKKYTEEIIQQGSNEEEMGSFLSEIEKLGYKCSISIKDIKPGKIIEEDEVKKYFVKLEIESKINEFADYIYQLESLPQLFRVENFTISPKGKNSFIMRIGLTISKIAFNKE